MTASEDENFVYHCSPGVHLEREPRRPDFIVRCDHGQRGGPATFVQRYRWMTNQDHWVPVRHYTVAATELRGNRPDDWHPAPADGPLRRALDNRCPECPNAVPTDDRNLQQVFAMLAGNGKRMRELRDMFAMRVSTNPPEITLTLDTLRLMLAGRNRLYKRAELLD